MSLLRIRVVNPALGVPRPTLVRSAVLTAMRQPICEACRFYAHRDSAPRCLHVDRKCELLALHRSSETCPISAWLISPNGNRPEQAQSAVSPSKPQGASNGHAKETA